MLSHIRSLVVVLFLIFASPVFAQGDLQDLPHDWHHLDLEADGFVGMSTYRAYDELLAGRTPERSVIVAVIDSGMDTSHVGFYGRFWINPNAEVDNGYVGDTYGWSFLGNADGENVDVDTYEYAREVARLAPRFDGMHSATIAEEDLPEFHHYRAMRDSLNAMRTEYQEYVGLMDMAVASVEDAQKTLERHFGHTDYTIEDVMAIDTYDQSVLQAVGLLSYFHEFGLEYDELLEQQSHIHNMLNFSLNPDFNPRHIVGDDYDNLDERYYGSRDVHGPDPSHGTGVGGLVTSYLEYEGQVIQGVARDSVFLMAIRAVPDGDEHDKDVANAIRYAVDNGAMVINMSFGKPISPQKSVVDEAIQYAMERGVIMIHAAGNDAWDNRISNSYPMRHLDDGTVAPLWFEIGASTAFPEGLPAVFTNYGAGEVDVFAPGDDVTSLSPGGGITVAGGTSFAAPQVAGLAALLMSYYPTLSGAEVMEIILESSTRFDGLEVPKPGSASGTMLPFSELSTTGGVINVYNAVRMADERVGNSAR